MINANKNNELVLLKKKMSSILASYDFYSYKDFQKI